MFDHLQSFFRFSTYIFPPDTTNYFLILLACFHVTRKKIFSKNLNTFDSLNSLTQPARIKLK